MRKVVRRHALQHGGRRLALSDSRRNLHQAVGRHCGVLGIAPQHRAVSYAIADSNLSYIVANRRNHARRFLSQDQRQRRLVTAFAVIDVNKVDARCLYLHHSFIRFRLRNRQVHQFHHFRPACMLDLYSFHSSFR